MKSLIGLNIARIISQIEQGALLSGRDASAVKLMAVTKTVDQGRVKEAIDAGITIIGENYVQEAAKKKAPLDPCGRLLEWHMIGHLQTNKVPQAIRLFDRIDSLDRLDLALEINKRAKAAGRVVKVLIEVNTGNEITKSGIPLSGATEFVKTVAAMENISIEGLMTIPPWFDNPEQARPYFTRLRELRDEIRALNIPGVAMQELSMGMTDDYCVAVEEGATMVRIGRGIFGERQKMT